MLAELGSGSGKLVCLVQTRGMQSLILSKLTEKLNPIGPIGFDFSEANTF
jgi:hypothetical protein